MTRYLVPLTFFISACGGDAPPHDIDSDAPDSELDTELDSGAPDSAEPDSADPDSAEPDSAEPDTTTPDTTTPDTGEPTWQDHFDAVFPSDHVVELSLTFAPGDWAQLLLDWQSSQLKNVYAAAFSFDEATLANVGVRLKGLNSLNVPDAGPIDPTARYPLKIDFNKLGGPRFHEVDELALNTSGNDASRMRDWLTAAMYRALDVEASRIAWADVTIDAAHIGVYVMAQVIDKRFLKERFGEADHADDGNLYKCVYNDFGACALNWLGDDPAAYVRTTGCARGYDRCGLVLQTNEDDPELNDYSDLIHLIDVLANTPDDDLAVELPKVFDVDHFLRLAAVAYVTSNFDSYFGKGHNYYLYRRIDGRFQMIPWDFDLAFGVTQCPVDPTDPSCGGADNHPLTRRIMAVPAWRDAYLAHLATLMAGPFSVDQLQRWVAANDALIGSYVASDPNQPSEGTYAEQIDSEADGVGNLFRFIEGRRAFIEQSLPR